MKIVIATVVLLAIGFVAGVAQAAEINFSKTLDSAEAELACNPLPAYRYTGIVPMEVAAKEPYFKFIDPEHPRYTTGIFDDLKGHSDFGGTLAILTHDGPMEWTPLTIGGTAGRGLGGPSLALGSSINLLPQVKSVALKVVKAIWPGDKFNNLKTILSPPKPGQVDITMVAAPHVNLVFYDGIKTRAATTMFYGVAWHY